MFVKIMDLHVSIFSYFTLRVFHHVQQLVPQRAFVLQVNNTCLYYTPPTFSLTGRSQKGSLRAYTLHGMVQHFYLKGPCCF